MVLHDIAGRAGRGQNAKQVSGQKGGAGREENIISTTNTAPRFHQPVEKRSGFVNGQCPLGGLSLLDFEFRSPDDAKIIKVAPSPLGAKGFFEGEDHTGHAVPVPDGPEDAIAKPE